MKTTIYLIRHGESQGNAVRAFLGHTNLDLTKKGHDQAECTAKYLKNIHADVIYSSDLLRAYSTAEHTAKIKGMDHGMGFILWVTDGYVSMLEYYAYNEDIPLDLSDYTLSYPN